MTPANLPPAPGTGTDLPASRASFSSCPPTCLGALRGRCLFRNHCLCVRLLELPDGREVGGCFAGCRGWLVVSAGRVEVRLNDAPRLLHEGESCTIRRGERLRVRAEEWVDVLFFEATTAGATER
jgi:hypothetical protein